MSQLTTNQELTSASVELVLSTTPKKNANSKQILVLKGLHKKRNRQKQTGSQKSMSFILCFLKILFDIREFFSSIIAAFDNPNSEMLHFIAKFHAQI